MMPYGSLDVIGVDGPTIAHLFLPHPPLAAQRVCGEPTTATCSIVSAAVVGSSLAQGPDPRSRGRP
jgi:hypothetical protein